MVVAVLASKYFSYFYAEHSKSLPEDAAGALQDFRKEAIDSLSLIVVDYDYWSVLPLSLRILEGRDENSQIEAIKTPI
jgi:hypothetical protein